MHIPLLSSTILPSASKRVILSFHPKTTFIQQLEEYTSPVPKWISSLISSFTIIQLSESLLYNIYIEQYSSLYIN